MAKKKTDKSSVTEKAKPKPGPAPKKASKPAFSKEVIPFEWKIVGNSSGLIVVLSKYTEREAAEKELGRLQEGGMYKSLRLEPIDAVIVQPVSKRKKPPKAAKEKKRASGKPADKAKAKTKSKAKTAKKAAPKRKAKPKAKVKARPKAKSKPKTRAKPKSTSKKKKK